MEPVIKNSRCTVVKWLARPEVCRVGIGQAKRLGDLDWSGTASVHQAYELSSGRVSYSCSVEGTGIWDR